MYRDVQDIWVSVSGLTNREQNESKCFSWKAYSIHSQSITYVPRDYILSINDIRKSKPPRKLSNRYEFYSLRGGGGRDSDDSGGGGLPSYSLAF